MKMETFSLYHVKVSPSISDVAYIYTRGLKVYFYQSVGLNHRKIYRTSVREMGETTFQRI